MLIIRLTELLILWSIFYFFLTQLLLPLWNDTKIFPLFRRKATKSAVADQKDKGIPPKTRK